MRYCATEAAALMGLKANTKVLALILAARTTPNHPDWPGRYVSFPSLEALEEDTGLSKRTLYRALNELADANIIRIYKDRRPGARWDHNVYEWTATESPNYDPNWMKRKDAHQEAVGARLTDEGWEYCRTHAVGPNVAATEHPEFVSPAEQPTLIDVPAAMDDAHDPLDVSPAKPERKPERKPEQKPEQKPADGFAEWWTQYPKKVKKLDAEKAYRAALKRRVTPKELLDGLQRQKAAWKAKGTELQYIPYPATWLRAGSWEDELDADMSNTQAPTINPTTGKAATKEDFWYACEDHGIDPRPYVNFWKPIMGLPGDPGWEEQQARLDRHTGRG